MKLVFVTCGADGCFFRNAVAAGKVPSLKDIKVIDTTGAGDIFGGAALSRILGRMDEGKCPESLTAEELTEIARFACTAAGLSTTRPGGISSVPDCAEVLAKMG